MDRDRTEHTVSRRTIPESTDHTTTESTNKWAEIAGQLIDRILGKNMSMTYPTSHNRYAKSRRTWGHIGSIQWTINGKITITCEAYEKRPG
jgi:hypothetical protein